MSPIARSACATRSTLDGDQSASIWSGSQEILILEQDPPVERQPRRSPTETQLPTAPENSVSERPVVDEYAALVAAILAEPADKPASGAPTPRERSGVRIANQVEARSISWLFSPQLLSLSLR